MGIRARQLLRLFTMGSHRRAVWEREIAFLKDTGVPAGFLRMPPSWTGYVPPVSR